jgi:NADH-quinone oxidoreductase subunit M
MKKLIAYSSVAHMGFVTMGIFTVNHQGIEGAMFQMLSPRPRVGRAVPVRRRVYDRLHTREIAAMAGWSTTCRAMPLPL